MRRENCRTSNWWPSSTTDPGLSKLPVPSAFPERFEFDKMHFSEAERAAEREAVWLGEAIFRVGPQGIDDVVAAIRKVQAHATELREMRC